MYIFISHLALRLFFLLCFRKHAKDMNLREGHLKLQLLLAEVMLSPSKPLSFRDGCKAGCVDVSSSN